MQWSPLYAPFLDIEKAFTELSDGSSFNPAIDLYEKGGSLIADAALVGFKPEDIKITIEDNVLSIEGSTEQKKEVDETTYYRREVRSGSFHRLITLPTAVNSDGITAEYQQGILRITMPKKGEHKSKPITIDVKKN